MAKKKRRERETRISQSIGCDHTAYNARNETIDERHRIVGAIVYTIILLRQEASDTKTNQAKAKAQRTLR